jgi:ribonuclease VapC
MATHVVDASALLALVFDEPGADMVLAAGSGGCCSAVNFSEALAKLSDRGVSAEDAEMHLAAVVGKVVVFDEDMARAAAALRARTRHSNVSFADRACLATAMSLGLPVITADRPWADLDVGVDIRLIR